MTLDLETVLDPAAAISRRDALRVAGSGVAFFGTQYRAAFAMGKPASGGENSSADRQSTKKRYSTFNRQKDPYGDVDRHTSDLAAILLAGERAPRCEIGSTETGPLRTALSASRSTRLGAESWGAPLRRTQ